ncbi:N-acetylmuramoyl-L-alanine amidase [Corynebacterium diphtheriae]|nr:N-acetylmuramoyl-L-alanine amidase [Corynebacterium diphtheriae]
MKNWETLEPDKYNLLTKNFSPGRGGESIKFITLHHMAMVGGVDECVRVWSQRPASTHYCIGPTGEIGQAVNDWDTAWANANLLSNQRSIAIEHSNSAGASQDWPIGEKTLEEGAHLVAALCRYYGLGRPESGKNIRFHCTESGGATSCPYHLRPGHKYHDSYMSRAQWWYDNPAGGHTQNTMVSKEKKNMNEAYSRDIKAQLTGSEDLGQYPGWGQLGGRTIVDALGAIGEKLGMDGFYDTKAGK